jgi:hypothetical protein
MHFMDFRKTIRTEEDAQYFIQEILGSMRFDDLMEVLAELPDSEEKDWLISLIHDELQSLRH